MDTKPYICTQQEKNALAFVEKCISLQEPCSIVGLADMGQEVLYRELFSSIPEKFPNYHFLTLFATSPEEIGTFEDMLLKNPLTSPTIVLLHLSTLEDVSSFIETLDKLRLNYSTAFIPVILSDIKSLSNALQSHKKTLTRSLFALVPLTTNDANALLDSLSNRFGFIPSKIQRRALTSFSTGYIGLLKSLYLLQKDNPKKLVDEEWLLKQDTIIYRLTKIASEFPTQQLFQLIDNGSLTEENTLLEKYGITHEGIIQNHLLFTFLTQQFRSPVKQAYLLFTPFETTAFTYFLEHSTETVERSVLAQFIWGEAWEEKYSDWAIDQLIHRIREKLEKTHAQYEIVTKKGEGFYLKQK